MSIEERGGYFEITPSLEIYTPDDSGTGKIVKYFQDQFALVSGIKLKFEEIEDRRNDQGIIIELLPEADLLGDEGYLLNVKNRKIELSAHQPAELFREVQTLFPIIPLNLQENNYWPE